MILKHNSKEYSLTILKLFGLYMQMSKWASVDLTYTLMNHTFAYLYINSKYIKYTYILLESAWSMLGDNWHNRIFTIFLPIHGLDQNQIWFKGNIRLISGEKFKKSGKICRISSKSRYLVSCRLDMVRLGRLSSKSRESSKKSAKLTWMQYFVS